MRIEVIKEEIIEDEVSLITCCCYSFWYFINKKSWVVEYLIRSHGRDISEVIRMPEVLIVDWRDGFIFNNEHTKVLEALKDFRSQKKLNIYREYLKKKYSNLYLENQSTGYR